MDEAIKAQERLQMLEQLHELPVRTQQQEQAYQMLIELPKYLAEFSQRAHIHKKVTDLLQWIETGEEVLEGVVIE